jgi:hypothetical protein
LTRSRNAFQPEPGTVEKGGYEARHAFELVEDSEYMSSGLLLPWKRMYWRIQWT